MEKITRIREIFNELADIENEKDVVIREYKYEQAADLRDREKILIDEVDELVGSNGYYHELIRMEEVNYHLENLKGAYFGLKKLDFSLGENFHIEIGSEALLDLQKKQLKIQQDILNFRVNVGLPEKKFDKKLAF